MSTDQTTQTRCSQDDGTFHTHHLTRLAELALKLPGVVVWRMVLRLRLATRKCPAWVKDQQVSA